MDKNEKGKMFLDYLEAQLLDYQRSLLFTHLALRLLIAIRELSTYGIIPHLNEWIADRLQRSNNSRKAIALYKRESRVELYYKMRKELLSVCQSFSEGKTNEEMIHYIDCVKEQKIQKKETLEYCFKCCLYLGYLINNNFRNTLEGKEKYDYLDNMLLAQSYEVIGYWTAKLEHKKRSKNQETKKQQEAIKEKYVTQTWFKMINNPSEKKALESLSQNKIAKRIQEKVMTDLKNIKTATGKHVLTRTKKIDKEGKTILSGLSIDTTIAIMRKQDKFTFNPFKK